MNTLIKANNLSKKFGDFTAVNQVSFSVKKGEIFGLLGPNGAGKTTILRMLSGLLTPTEGQASIAGHNMQQEQMQARRSLGFLTGDMDLYRRLKPKELLLYFGKLYQVSEKELHARVDHLIDVFGITDFTDRYCEKLSTGQKQRVSIARTLVHDPKVVILDEPTTGLDIMSSEFILKFIEKMAKEEGKALIFSTHNLSEVERICDRIAVIKEGRLLYLGNVQGLKDKTQKVSLNQTFFHLVNQPSSI